MTWAVTALLVLAGCDTRARDREEPEPGGAEVTDVTAAGRPRTERAPEADQGNATGEELLAPGDHGEYDDPER